MGLSRLERKGLIISLGTVMAMTTLNLSQKPVNKVIKNMEISEEKTEEENYRLKDYLSDEEIENMNYRTTLVQLRKIFDELNNEEKDKTLSFYH